MFDIIDDHPSQQDALEEKEIWIEVVKTINNFDPRLRYIMEHRYFSDPVKTQSAVAKELGLSSQYIQKLEQKAIRLIRESLRLL